MLPVGVPGPPVLGVLDLVPCCEHLAVVAANSGATALMRRRGGAAPSAGFVAGDIGWEELLSPRFRIDNGTPAERNTPSKTRGPDLSFCRVSDAELSPGVGRAWEEEEENSKKYSYMECAEQDL